jgi:hypothetical protein
MLQLMHNGKCNAELFWADFLELLNPEALESADASNKSFSLREGLAVNRRVKATYGQVTIQSMNWPK